MLVEDDNNLREIYGARLLAEGYEIVAAKDGEEALAMAVKEKPDLIISDIMMPKISGFDMLDILRSTPETKDTKVIMMTALSQAEDKERAGKLGADRYLVKSQVTLEDVAKAAAEVLGTEAAPTPTPAEPAEAVVTPAVAPTTVTPEPAAATPAVAPTTPPADTVVAPAPEPATPVTQVAPVAPTPQPVAPTTVAPEPTTVAPTAPATPPAEPAATAAPVAPTPTAIPVTEPTVTVSAPATDNSQVLANTVAAVGGTPAATPTDNTPKTSVHTKVIEPINDLTANAPDLNKLLAEEEANATPAAPAAPAPQPISTEQPAVPANQDGTNVAITPDGTIQS